MDSQEGTPTPPDQEVIMKCVNITKTLNLRVESLDNIDDVKDKVSELENIETNLQKVFFTEKNLENDQALDYERKDGSSVHMNLHLGVGMQIRIEVPWSTKLTPLDVHSWDTIGDVKTKFQDKEGTPANQLTLFCDGKQLDDDFQTLAGYDIENYSILHAVLIGEDKIKITVCPPGNCDPIQVMVKLCSTVVNLKRMIHWMGGFPVDRQELTLNGVLLENSQRLADYKIQMGSVIDLGVGMQIRIEVPWSTTLTPLDVHSWDTIGDVKTKFQDKEGTPANQLTIFCDGKQLDDDLQTLAGYDIENDSILHAVLIGEDKIKISVHCPDRDPIQVMVKLCSTVENLKGMIHWMGGFPVDKQELTLNRVLLENSHGLADYKIQMGSVIDLDVFSSNSTGKKIRVFVRRFAGEKHTIYMDSSDTIHNLKTAIKNVHGTPEKEQVLRFAGRQLEDGCTLVDYHITKESVLCEAVGWKIRQKSTYRLY